MDPGENGRGERALKLQKTEGERQNRKEESMYYLDSWCEKLGDGGLQFVGQRKQKDAEFINKLLLNASSTQQLKRRHSLEYNHTQHVTANCYEDPSVVVTPCQCRHRLPTLSQQ